MHLVNVAGRVGNPGDGAQPVTPDIHSPGLAEPQRPGDVGAFQPQLAEHRGTLQIVSAKDIEPEELTGPDLAAHVGGIRGQPHP